MSRNSSCTDTTNYGQRRMKTSAARALRYGELGHTKPVSSKVRLKGATDTTEGVIVGQLDGLLRVKWSDGLHGIYWRFQLELL